MPRPFLPGGTSSHWVPFPHDTLLLSRHGSGSEQTTVRGIATPAAAPPAWDTSTSSSGLEPTELLGTATPAATLLMGDTWTFCAGQGAWSVPPFRSCVSCCNRGRS
ncbi:MAG: hypothetical protein AAF226_03240 [Verrucomicrobiota bacterium]